ncbi:MAG: hypothetical protein KGJ07_08665, partial [Patescibacteria group bacterium]|nr:hypothetical protein [Patescibacteria group bacterium]
MALVSHTPTAQAFFSQFTNGKQLMPVTVNLPSEQFLTETQAAISELQVEDAQFLQSNFNSFRKISKKDDVNVTGLVLAANTYDKENKSKVSKPKLEILATEATLGGTCVGNCLQLPVKSSINFGMDKANETLQSDHPLFRVHYILDYLDMTKKDENKRTAVLGQLTILVKNALPPSLKSMVEYLTWDNVPKYHIPTPDELKEAAKQRTGQPKAASDEPRFPPKKSVQELVTMMQDVVNDSRYAELLCGLCKAWNERPLEYTINIPGRLSLREPKDSVTLHPYSVVSVEELTAHHNIIPEIPPTKEEIMSGKGSPVAYKTLTYCCAREGNEIRKAAHGVADIFHWLELSERYTKYLPPICDDAKVDQNLYLIRVIPPIKLGLQMWLPNQCALSFCNKPLGNNSEKNFSAGRERKNCIQTPITGHCWEGLFLEQDKDTKELLIHMDKDIFHKTLVYSDIYSESLSSLGFAAGDIDKWKVFAPIIMSNLSVIIPAVVDIGKSLAQKKSKSKLFESNQSGDGSKEDDIFTNISYDNDKKVYNCGIVDPSTFQKCIAAVLAKHASIPDSIWWFRAVSALYDPVQLYH